MSELSDRLREAAGSRSINEVKRLIEEAGKSVSRQTVAVFLRGDHGPRPTEDVLEAFAAGLQIDIRELRELAGRARGELGPWVPTQEAASLTKEQRDAMDALIKTIVKEGGSDSGQDEAQKMKRSMQAADDGQPPATVHDMRDASEGTVGTHALPPNWEQALAADQQDDEPVGERLRREQDEAAERGHDEGGDQ